MQGLAEAGEKKRDVEFYMRKSWREGEREEIKRARPRMCWGVVIDVVHGFAINQVDIQRGEIHKCGFWRYSREANISGCPLNIISRSSFVRERAGRRSREMCNSSTLKNDCAGGEGC